MKKKYQNIILMFVVLIVIIFLIEVILHLVYRDNLMNSPNTVKVITTKEYNYTAQTNNQGLRELKEFEKYSDKKRILFIGDSVVFGSGVDIQDTFVKRLEQKLNSFEDKYEVINFAKPGVGPIEYLKIEKYGIKEFNPDIILVGFTVENDIVNVKDPASSNFMKGLYKNSYLFRLAVGTYTSMKSKSDKLERYDGVNEAYIINGIRYPGYYYDPLTLTNPEINKSFDMTMEYFNKMNFYAKENNVTLIIVLIPSSMQLSDLSHDFLNDLGYKMDESVIDNRIVQEESIKYFDENDINHIDLYEDLKKAESIEEVYFETDLHLTNYGNEAVADILKTNLINNEEFY